MHTYAIYDQPTGVVLDVVVCPGPFRVSDELIEALVESGNLGRVAFTEVDARVGIPRVIHRQSQAEAAGPELASAPAGPIDFEKVA